jgi:hypothetical protein
VNAMLRLRGRHLLWAVPLVTLPFAACSGQPKIDNGGLAGDGGTFAATGGTGVGGMAGTAPGTGGATGSTGGVLGRAGAPIVDPNQQPMENCEPVTCAGLGYACGYILDPCGNKTVNCADEGLTCGPLEACTGGLDGPTVCASSLGEGCTLCGDVADCSTATQPTRLTGRVVTPGRDDANTANQVGVPNAFVYILRSADEAELPPIATGIPTGGTACDRCGEQDLGPVLVGGMTDAKGNFTLEGNVPVGAEFVLVVKAGKFRRATKVTLPADAACKDNALPTTLPENPARLPRHMADGIAVNMPRVAVATGSVDAIECVLEKMGVSATTEFGNPGADGTAAPRVHLYRGGRAEDAMAVGGARIDDMTPQDTELFGTLARLQTYDIVIADCEGGPGWDIDRVQRDAQGPQLREYLNRGGRVFMSHVSHTWLEDNGDVPYDPMDPIATGLGPAATWNTATDGTIPMGPGVISMARPQTSPRIQSFADWMANEMVVVPPSATFTILEPGSQNLSIGTSTEEFVYREDGDMSTQQFSFNTPYGAPPEAICGRVAYSGFHVAVGDTRDAIFPAHCAGDLSAQEKVLLYMLFDLSACVGEVPPPPDCTPGTCVSLGAECGFTGDGCGGVLDCGPCPIPPPK